MSVKGECVCERERESFIRNFHFTPSRGHWISPFNQCPIDLIDLKRSYTLREEDRKKLDFENDERLILENFTERKKTFNMLNASDLSGKLFPEYVTETSTCFLSSLRRTFFFLVRLHFVSEPKKTHTHNKQVMMVSTRKHIMLLEPVDSKRCTKE